MFERLKVRQDFSAAAGRYDAHAALQHQVLAELTGRLPLRENALILDAGCGTGRLARGLGGHRVVQLDIAHAMCVKAAFPDAPAVNGTLEALPFAGGVFDAAVSSLALQWVPDWAGALAEMRRVLKPGGILAASVFGPDTLRELKESFSVVDDYPHASSFPPRDAFPESQTLTEYYHDLPSLMRHLKAIGARNKMAARRRSLMTAGQMRRVEQYYKARFGTPSGLPVTWEIMYLVQP